MEKKDKVLVKVGKALESVDKNKYSYLFMMQKDGDGETILIGNSSPETFSAMVAGCILENTDLLLFFKIGIARAEHQLLIKGTK